jgi:hypothetical protein
MKRSIVISVIISLFLLIPSKTVFSVDNKTVQIKKQTELQQVKPKKPVKIKLKRSGESKYTWDLTGDDVDEIVRTDKRLKKLLNIE